MNLELQKPLYVNDFDSQSYSHNWRWFTIRDLLPVRFFPRPACYVVYLDEKLHYIGSTYNIKKRFQGYKIKPVKKRWGVGGGFNPLNTAVLTPWGQCQSLFIKVRYSKKYGDWAMQELRLIRKLQPPGNCLFSTKRRVV